MPATPNLGACRQFEMYARSCPARNRIFSRAELQRFQPIENLSEENVETAFALVPFRR